MSKVGVKIVTLTLKMVRCFKAQNQNSGIFYVHHVRGIGND